MKPGILAALLALALATAPTADARLHGGSAPYVPSGGGATPVFNYSSGFASAGSAIDMVWGAALSGGSVHLCDASRSAHQTGFLWYTTKQNINAFTTDWSFQIQAGGFGMTFIIQNSDSTTNPGNGGGLNANGDSNGLGYFVYESESGTSSQFDEPIYRSIAIKFDTTVQNQNGSAYKGAVNTAVGLYANAGPWVDQGAVPEQSTVPLGINLSAGDTLTAHVVYDGSILTMVLVDTTTGAQTRLSWPLNLAAVTTASTAWVGFGCGTVTPATEQVTAWDWYSGYNARLATPTFSVAGGQYGSAQTVSITGPTGASIYYTTDGTPPTTSSTLYTGPITVSASEYVQAVAVEATYTDSLVAAANYQIGASTNVINLTSFTGTSGLVTTLGAAAVSSGALQLTDISHDNETAAAWYVAPVSISSFTTAFTLQYPTVQVAPSAGTAFVLQNQTPASADATALAISGGPWTLGSGGANYMGYSGLYGQIIPSVAIKFDLSNNSTAVLINGAAPSTSSTVMTGINLASGHPMAVTLTYSGTTLGFSITDTTTSTTYTHSFTGVDIPGTLGGSTAYVGFTAGEGYAASGNQGAIQDVTAWTFHN